MPLYTVQKAYAESSPKDDLGMNQQQLDSHYSKKHYLILVCIIILGSALRFWGLGRVGLHGDEEIMALATLGILKTDAPIMPSGFFYPRALCQLYLMALSLNIFGISEWALRFPSAITGIIGIVVAFFLGKRFLPPIWNLLFVLVIALNPWMIEFSQTARMYIFLSTSLMLYVSALFVWEENSNWTSLVFAFLVFLLALQFHSLAIFFSFLFLFPVITRPSTQRLLQGSLAFTAAGFIFLGYSKWMSSQYPITYADKMRNMSVVERISDNLIAFKLLLTHHWWSVGLLLMLCLFIIFLISYSNKSKSPSHVVAICLFIGTIGACFLLKYHVAFVFFICAMILFFRSRGRMVQMVILALCMGLLFLSQFYLLYCADIFSGVNQILKTLIDKPSVFQFEQLFKGFPVGFSLLTIVIICTMRNIATGSKVPEYFAFFAISVWIPLLGMGFFRHYFPFRFIFPVVPFFILSCIAGILYLKKTPTSIMNLDKLKYKSVFFLIIVLAFIQPSKLGITAGAGYEMWPDHKGAATFMKRIDLNSKDILIALDVLQQTYYLGKVDYWLRGIDHAKKHTKEKQGALFSMYTNVPLIGTGEELENLIRNRNRGSIYIIGSGETAGNPKYFMSNGILEVINKYNPKIIFIGRDQITKIWYFLPPNKCNKDGI